MREVDLDRAFPGTPLVFSDRVEQTLHALKEEPMKRFTLRTAALTAAILLALAGIAYAAIHYGQEWYYDTRYTAYEEHKPEKYKAVMDNLQTGIPQEVTGPAAEWVDFHVLDAAWAPDQHVMTISMLATVKDDKTYEMHTIQEMDTDGATVGRIDPDDEESRMDHWLWTYKGFGLPKDVMIDPQKQLLIIDVWSNILIGDTDVPLPHSTSDYFTTQEGPVYANFEMDLLRLTPQEALAGMKFMEVQDGEDPVAHAAMIEKTKKYIIDSGEASAAAIAANTDENGLLSLRFPFSVQTFQDNAYGEPVPGELRFKVKLDGK